MGNGIWRYGCTALGTMLLMGVGWYFTEASEHVTRAEMNSTLKERVEGMELNLRSISQKITVLLVRQAEVRVEINNIKKILNGSHGK